MTAYPETVADGHEKLLIVRSCVYDIDLYSNILASK
jgi:hypothetical protein